MPGLWTRGVYTFSGLHPHSLEEDVENLVGIGQFWGGSFGFFGGLGVFFIGIALLWWTSLQAKNKGK